MPTVYDADSLITQLREVQSLIADHAMLVAARVARKVRQKYPWIDADDMTQNLLLRLDKWVAEYQPNHASATSWSKYLTHKMQFYAKDLLRKEDPLGIGWPQRKNYPTWFRLGEQSSRMTAGAKPTEAASHAGLPSHTVGADLSPADLGDQFIGRDQQDAEQSEQSADAAWMADYVAIHRFLRDLPRPAHQIPVVAESDTLRHARCLHWDTRRNRVRFRRRKSDTLAHWIAARKSGSQPPRPRSKQVHKRQLLIALE